MTEYNFFAKHENIDFARIARENEGVKVLVVEWTDKKGQQVAVTLYSRAFLSRLEQAGIEVDTLSCVEAGPSGRPMQVTGTLPDWRVGWLTGWDPEKVRKDLEGLLDRLVKAERAVLVTVTRVVI